MSNNVVYMDYASTTPVDPRVIKEILPYYSNYFGNASSRSHVYGWEAEEAVEKARKRVADLIGASEKEIIFTSGSTESNNLAIVGVAEMYREKGNHIISCVSEHKSVLDPVQYLQSKGYELTLLKIDKYGSIDLDQLRDAIKDNTILITLMTVNNETGVIHPIEEISKIAKKNGVIFHSDGTQAVGKMPIDVNKMGVDLFSLSAHKVYGPKGVGALYIRRKNPRVRLSAILHGGGHERGMRSGTLNVPGIVGIGATCNISKEQLESDIDHVLKIRKKLILGLNEIDMVVFNSHPEKCIPNIVNASFEYIEGESLMMGIGKVAVASGSACTSASLEPSYVLKHAGLGDELAHSSIRFSFGRFTTEKEVDIVINDMKKTVNKLREMSPLYELVQEGVDLSSINWTTH